MWAAGPGGLMGNVLRRREEPSPQGDRGVRAAQDCSDPKANAPAPRWPLRILLSPGQSRLHWPSSCIAPSSVLTGGGSLPAHPAGEEAKAPVRGHSQWWRSGGGRPGPSNSEARAQDGFSLDGRSQGGGHPPSPTGRGKPSLSTCSRPGPGRLGCEVHGPAGSSGSCPSKCPSLVRPLRTRLQVPPFSWTLRPSHIQICQLKRDVCLSGHVSVFSSDKWVKNAHSHRLTRR